LLTLARALTTAAHTTTQTAAQTAAQAATTTTTDPGAVPDNAGTESCGNAAPRGGSLVGAPLGVVLESLTDGQAVEWAQSLEQLNHFLQALLVQVAGDLAHRVRAGRFNQTGAGTPAGLLMQSLLLGRVEANRRLRLAGTFMATPGGCLINCVLGFLI
uniref:hypothetical protein n=1 Tax=Arthrobacter sp. GMC3 TaxID=2058894 RepID=UPI0015E2F39B